MTLRYYKLSGCECKSQREETPKSKPKKSKRRFWMEEGRIVLGQISGFFFPQDSKKSKKLWERALAGGLCQGRPRWAAQVPSQAPWPTPTPRPLGARVPSLGGAHQVSSPREPRWGPPVGCTLCWVGFKNNEGVSLCTGGARVRL